MPPPPPVPVSQFTIASGAIHVYGGHPIVKKPKKKKPKTDDEFDQEIEEQEIEEILAMLGIEL